MFTFLKNSQRSSNLLHLIYLIIFSSEKERIFNFFLYMSTRCSLGMGISISRRPGGIRMLERRRVLIRRRVKRSESENYKLKMSTVFWFLFRCSIFFFKFQKTCFEQVEYVDFVFKNSA